MAHEILVKRTIYESKCQCGENDIRQDNPPRERRCKCGEWVPYVENSVIGPEIKSK